MYALHLHVVQMVSYKQFHCSYSGINCIKVYQDTPSLGNNDNNQSTPGYCSCSGINWIKVLAKRWTATRGAAILGMAIVSSQLLDEQQKHQKFRQFLALSKCHEELCSEQRRSLQTILERVEMLAAMIQLRELQNVISQKHSSGVGSFHSVSESQTSGALWDLIQLVGESARRSTVLLMDRNDAEVFYSKVSELEEVFYCLDRLRKYIISMEQPFGAQIQRACELSNACVTVLHTAMQYKNEHHLW